MATNAAPLNGIEILDAALGYLNFSGGSPDPRFQANLTYLFCDCQRRGGPQGRPWEVLAQMLCWRLEQLERDSEAFRETTQARAVIEIALARLPGAYREFHCDLLAHQTDQFLFQPLFLARACEAVLQARGPWGATERILAIALETLNDYVGYRPLAATATGDTGPYAHEQVAAIPFFLRDAGMAAGKYAEIIQWALVVLNATDDNILAEAGFDPGSVDELAMDPRAYEFTHPVDQRSSYHVGTWDPDRLDEEGRFRRFVLQQVYLDLLLQYVNDPRAMAVAHDVSQPFVVQTTTMDGQIEDVLGHQQEKRLFEAGVLLAAGILDASKTSCAVAEGENATTDVAQPSERMNDWKETFFRAALDTLETAEAAAYRAEATETGRALAGARDELQSRLHRRRKSQAQSVRLALLYADMGFPEACDRQLNREGVTPHAKLMLDLRGLLRDGKRALDESDLAAAADLAPQFELKLRSAIECGVLPDPAGLRVFGGSFPVGARPDERVRDVRAPVLLQGVERAFGLYARVQREATAGECQSVAERAAGCLEKLADWWDQFGAEQGPGELSVSGREAVQSAHQVAGALAAWRKAGLEAGDVAFWRQQTTQFDSPTTYQLVLETLIGKSDFLASMALLIHWVGHGIELPLRAGDASFQDQALAWMKALWRTDRTIGDGQSAGDVADRWKLAQKFLDYLEANSGDDWDAPWFESADEKDSPRNESGKNYGLFAAAYEDVTYTDGADDEFDEERWQEEDDDPRPNRPSGRFRLAGGARRLVYRLTVLKTIAALWGFVALASHTTEDDEDVRKDRFEALREWSDHARQDGRRLLDLARSIHDQVIPRPEASAAGLFLFEAQRYCQDSLLRKIVGVYLEMTDASRRCAAAAGDRWTPGDEMPKWQQQATVMLAAMLRGDAEAVRAAFPKLRDLLDQQTTLYAPLGMGGNPVQIAEAYELRRTVAELIRILPRLGLLRESAQLVETAEAMERHRPAGSGAQSDFDRHFAEGYRAIADALIAAGGDCTRTDAVQVTDRQLLERLFDLTQHLSECWRKYGRRLVRSPLEKVFNTRRWDELVRFIRRYGHDLFQPDDITPVNLRGMLNQGPLNWLKRLEARGKPRRSIRLLRDLGSIDQDAVNRHLSLIIEAILQHHDLFEEYRASAPRAEQGERLYVWLDLLRLKARFDRATWTVRPFFLAHDALVRNGRWSAAHMWRQSVVQAHNQSTEIAQSMLAELYEKYHIRLPSIDRQFTAGHGPRLRIDHARAMVEPAMRDARQGVPSRNFMALEKFIDGLLDDASINLPEDWLGELNLEVSRSDVRIDEPRMLLEPNVPLKRLHWDEIRSLFPVTDPSQPIAVEF